MALVHAMSVETQIVLGLLPLIVLFAILGTVALIAAMAGLVAAWDWTARKIAR